MNNYFKIIISEPLGMVHLPTLRVDRQANRIMEWGRVTKELTSRRFLANYS